MYVGEGEVILRETFRQALCSASDISCMLACAEMRCCPRRRARLVAPSIVFLDELDSLVGKLPLLHTKAGRGNSSAVKLLCTHLQANSQHLQSPHVSRLDTVCSHNSQRCALRLLQANELKESRRAR